LHHAAVRLPLAPPSDWQDIFVAMTRTWPVDSDPRGPPSKATS
jgi:hypothetical protein